VFAPVLKKEVVALIQNFQYILVSIRRGLSQIRESDWFNSHSLYVDKELQRMRCILVK